MTIYTIVCVRIEHTTNTKSSRILDSRCGLDGVSVCFFFQAEDGIRDCLLSRGLGDVIRDRTTRVSNPL